MKTAFPLITVILLLAGALTPASAAVGDDYIFNGSFELAGGLSVTASGWSQPLGPAQAIRTSEFGAHSGAFAMKVIGVTPDRTQYEEFTVLTTPAIRVDGGSEWAATVWSQQGSGTVMRIHFYDANHAYLRYLDFPLNAGSQWAARGGEFVVPDDVHFLDLAITATVTSLALVDDISLVLLEPKLFQEKWDDGISSWRVENSTASVGCTTANPCLSMRAPSSNFLYVEKDVAIPITGTVVYSVAFRGSSTQGNADTGALLRFSSGDQLALQWTGGSSGPNNGIYLWEGDQIANATTWTSTSSWYTGVITISETGRIQLTVRGANGQLLGTSAPILMTSGAPGMIVEIAFYSVSWGSVQTYQYDDVLIVQG